jgi:hypothetical protein
MSTLLISCYPLFLETWPRFMSASQTVLRVSLFYIDQMIDLSSPQRSFAGRSFAGGAPVKRNGGRLAGVVVCFDEFGPMEPKTIANQW